VKHYSSFIMREDFWFEANGKRIPVEVRQGSLSRPSENSLIVVEGSLFFAILRRLMLRRLSLGLVRIYFVDGLIDMGIL